MWKVEDPGLDPDQFLHLWKAVHAGGEKMLTFFLPSSVASQAALYSDIVKCPLIVAADFKEVGVGEQWGKSVLQVYFLVCTLGSNAYFSG